MKTESEIQEMRNKVWNTVVEMKASNRPDYIIVMQFVNLLDWVLLEEHNMLVGTMDLVKNCDDGKLNLL